MTATQTWTLTGLAAVALVAGALLATGAVGSAQEGTPTPTPAATEDPADDTSTPTPVPSDGDDESEDADGESEGHSCGGAKPLIFDNAAEILGMTEDELREAKMSGQSLADIAVAQGMTVEDFSAQLEESVRADLQAQLSAGEITQEQFDEISADVDEKLDEIINSTGGLRFGGRGAPEDLGGDGTRFRAPFEEAPAGTDA